MPEAATLFVVPIRNASVLCSVDQGRLVEICPVPMPVLADHGFNEFGWIAWIEEHMGETICRVHSDAQPHEQCFPPITLPHHFSATSIAFLGQDLFVATAREVVVLDFNQTMPEWLPLFCRGSVDRILITGEDLITIGAPEWETGLRETALTRYEGVRSRQLKRSVRARSPMRGSFERAAVGPNWLAVLESSSFMMSETLHLSLFDAHTLEECAHLSSATTYGLLVHGESGQPIPHAETWRDVAWLGDILFLASGKRGVGVLDLRRMDKPGHGEAGEEEEQTIERFSAQCNQRLHYWPLPHDLLPGEVVRVFPVAAGQVLAVVKLASGYETTLFDIPGLA